MVPKSESSSSRGKYNLLSKWRRWVYNNRLLRNGLLASNSRVSHKATFWKSRVVLGPLAIYYTRVVNCFLVIVWGQHWTRVAWTSDEPCTLHDCKKQAWRLPRSAVCTLEDAQLNLENVRRGSCTERRIYYTRVVNQGVRSGRLQSS